MSPRLWRLRWMLRIGLRVSDGHIDEAIRRWTWRSGGQWETFVPMLAATLDILGRAEARTLLLSVLEGPHPPPTWWDE